MKHGIIITILIGLGLVSQATAKQNQYKSVSDRIHQEIHDKTHPDPYKNVYSGPNDPHQEIMNDVYGGSNEKGYKLDEDGNDVPLDE